MLKLFSFKNYHNKLILEMLKAANSGAVASNILGPLISITVLHTYFETICLSIWFVLHLVLFTMRLKVSNKLISIIKEDINYKIRDRYLLFYNFMLVMTAILYALISMMSIYNGVEDLNLFIIITIIITLTAGSISTLGTVFLVFISFMISSLIPFFFILLYHGGMLFDIFAYMILIYLVVHIMSGYRLFLVHKDSIELEEKFKTIYNKSSDGILIIKNNSFFDCNERIVDMFGYENKEEFLKVELSCCTPKYQPDGESSFKKIISLLKIAKDEKVTFEWLQQKKDSTKFWVEIVLTPMILNNEHVIHGIWRDINDKKESQKALEQKNKQLEDSQLRSAEKEKILDNSLNEIYIFDATTYKFLYVNKGAQNNTGYSFEELVKLTPMDLKDDMNRDDFSLILRDINHTDNEYIFFSTEQERKNSTKYDADIYLQSTIFDGKEAYVAIILDVTTRKKAEDKIKQMNDNLQDELHSQLEILREKDEQILQQSKLVQMGDMISMIAHQWRQPLNAISASSINLSLMSTMGVLEDDKLQENSTFIQEQTQKMSTTIDTFLNFVKPSQDSKKFTLNATVESVMQIMGTQLVNHDIKVDLKLDKIISLVGHEDLLEQVIINILSNARDAFEDIEIDNKFIKIEVDKVDNIPLIIIEDNAGGIPIDIRDKIFNPYFTTKEQGKGTGIGLYMSLDIMKKSFSGDLRYKATQKGSLFRVVCGGYQL